MFLRKFSLWWDLYVQFDISITHYAPNNSVRNGQMVFAQKLFIIAFIYFQKIYFVSDLLFQWKQTELEKLYQGYHK